VDGTDDDMLWNGIKEDGVVGSECERDEGIEITEKPHVIKSKKLQTIEIMMQAAWLHHFHCCIDMSACSVLLFCHNHFINVYRRHMFIAAVEFMLHRTKE